MEDYTIYTFYRNIIDSLYTESMKKSFAFEKIMQDW